MAAKTKTAKGRSLGEILLDADPELRASFEANTEKRDLALALRSLRRWAGLTQAEVAERSGLSQSHISKIEAATGPMPTTETLHRYAAACDAKVQIGFLARRTGKGGGIPKGETIAAAVV